MDKIPFIYNPVAGPKGLKRAQKAANTLNRTGHEPLLMATDKPGSATSLAQAVAGEGFPLVVVAGGDGTVNEAINGLAGTRTELAIIPTGSANVLAIELGIPTNIDKACRVAVSGESLLVDLGRAGDRHFALMAGAGFDAFVIKNLNPVLKKTIRKAAYPVAGMKAMVKEDLPLLRVKAGERDVEGYFVVAANSRYYGGHFGPTPEASMTDGLLDICVLKEKSFQKMVDFWYKTLTADVSGHPNVEVFRAAAIDLSASGESGPVPVQVDGEMSGELPMHVSVVPQALRVRIGAGR